MENQAKAEYVYEINKNDQAKIDSIFSKDEQKIFEDRIAARDKASADLSDYLIDLGFLSSKDMADDYVRFVMSEE